MGDLQKHFRILFFLLAVLGTLFFSQLGMATPACRDQTSKAIELSTSVVPLISETRFQLNDNCGEKFGSEAQIRLSSALDRGLSCLKNGGEGARASSNHIRCLNGLAANKSRPVRVTCEKFDSLASMRASFMDDRDFPQITINAVFDSTFSDGSAAGLFFHEMLHLCGHLHLRGIDFAYACQSCCFNQESPGTDSAACRICRNYTDPNDIRLYRDLAQANMESGFGVAYTDHFYSQLFKNSGTSPEILRTYSDFHLRNPSGDRGIGRIMDIELKRCESNRRPVCFGPTGNLNDPATAVASSVFSFARGETTSGFSRLRRMMESQPGELPSPIGGQVTNLMLPYIYSLDLSVGGNSNRDACWISDRLNIDVSIVCRGVER